MVRPDMVMLAVMRLELQIMMLLVVGVLVALVVIVQEVVVEMVEMEEHFLHLLLHYYPDFHLLGKQQ